MFVDVLCSVDSAITCSHELLFLDGSLSVEVWFYSLVCLVKITLVLYRKLGWALDQSLAVTVGLE